MDGKQIGIMSPREALQIARELDLDLIEVDPNARPPVCRIMDYGKYKYQLRKKEKDSARHARSLELKTVRIRPSTDEHDFQVKLRNARRFLERKRKVRINMMFRGREIVHQDLAREKLMRLAQELADVGEVERMPALEGRNMTMIIAPKASD